MTDVLRPYFLFVFLLFQLSAACATLLQRDDRTLMELIVADANLSEFHYWLDSTLENLFSSASVDITLFAPTNRAFGTLLEHYNDSRWSLHVRNVLETHVHLGAVVLPALGSSSTISMINGEDVSVIC